MNCKPGDLAICIKARSAPHFVGKIVKCVSIEPCYADPHWNTDPEFRDPVDGRKWVFTDSGLRPIRDQDGTDETLLWAPVPKEKVKA